MFSSPGSVLAMAIWRSREGWILTTLNLRDVAAERFEPLQAPGAHQTVEAPTRDGVLLLHDGAERVPVEEDQRALENGADLVACLEDVDRMGLD